MFFFVELVVRSHEVKPLGYEYQKGGKCLTVFSAPNYCYRCGNEAAIMEVDEFMNRTFLQFDPAPKQSEPDHLIKRTPDYFLWKPDMSKFEKNVCC